MVSTARETSSRQIRWCKNFVLQQFKKRSVPYRPLLFVFWGVETSGHRERGDHSQVDGLPTGFDAREEGVETLSTSRVHGRVAHPDGFAEGRGFVVCHAEAEEERRRSPHTLRPTRPHSRGRAPCQPASICSRSDANVFANSSFSAMFSFSAGSACSSYNSSATTFDGLRRCTQRV